MITVYGLKNCDTCRNALKWLKADGIDHTFVDVRADGLSAQDISGWVKAVGWETLLNRRGTTWRKLEESDKENVDQSKAETLMLTHPALIKRPVFVKQDTVIVGFKDPEKAALKSL
jgi:arsenate reductase (glutaredoxin)